MVKLRQRIAKLEISDMEGKQAEKELRESHHFIQKITESAPGVIYVYDLLKEKNVYASKSLNNVLGYTPQEFEAMGDKVLGKLIYPDDLGSFMEYLEKLKKVKGDKVYEHEYRMKHKDAHWVWILNRDMIFIRDEKGKPLQTIGTASDITERKRAEEQIRASLKEKEVLLQEIHHRVKNNMQIISSILHLQSSVIKHKRALELFKSSQNRIKSMALIHEKLYKSKDFNRIDFSKYVQSLSNDLFRVYGINPDVIKLNIDIKDVLLNINTAIPCGLIINELVSNSLKYAFPDGRKGKIKIAMFPLNKNEIELTVSDNGIGIPEEVGIRGTKSLGLHLITILAEDQLQGEITMDKTKGTIFHMILRMKK